MTKVIKVPESHLEVISSPLQESQPTALSQLKYAEPTELYLRDGEVVLFRRPNSPLWQCRFKRHFMSDNNKKAHYKSGLSV